jgi:hypothetical protein
MVSRKVAIGTVRRAVAAPADEHAGMDREMGARIFIGRDPERTVLAQELLEASTVKLRGGSPRLDEFWTAQGEDIEPCSEYRDQDIRY